MEAVSLTGITPVQMLLENGLDKMKKDYVSFFIGVSSYQELIACFTLVLESLECGEIQPWIHHGSGSLLSKLIQQSYHGKMEAVSLTGITPVQMLLENGLDKMKKDYVSFFIGVSSYQELIACFTLVLESLECGEIQPWIHHGSGSLLSKLIQQSYHGKMEAVSLTGITPVQMLLENGLDKMKKDYVSFFIGVSSYQELIACFTLVLESLECGEIQPWIHHGSGSLLSKLIQQSYHGKMEAVSLTGITPVQMLLENGLDKMKKDYVSFFIGLLHFHISRFTRTSSLCSKASPYVGNNGQLSSPTSVQTREPLPLDTVIISFYFLLLK
ncbi:uncharacterized protein AAGF69_010033 [Amazona ochrocephala]